MRSLLLGLAVMFVAATPATADFPGVNGKIAFDRGYGGGEVWLTNQDGSGQHKIAGGREPAWSVDGTKIAYVTEYGGTSISGELALMNADGSGQHVLDTDLGPSVANPSWSPDGKQILVSAFGDLYVVPLAGGRARLLVRDARYPEWSPDGSLIAFVRGTATIMLANPDGSGVHALAPSGLGNTTNRRFSWSPDGKRIAFRGVQDGGIDAINLDGTGLVRLLPPGNFGRSIPAWSPDGTRIAFFENADLCTGGTDGTGNDVARLTWTPSNPVVEPPSDPAWQPLPPGSQPAGVAGRSVGPPPDYPRGIPWYPSCDRPVDNVTISSTGPSLAVLGSWVTYTLQVRNEGSAPIGPVQVGDILSSKVPYRRPSPSQGRCAGFTRSELPGHPQVSECDLGGLLPRDTVTIRVRLRMTRLGTFTNTASEAAGWGVPTQRFTHVDTRVVRR